MKIILLLLLLITRWQAIAQSSSVVMSINGKVVSREEFEYAYKALLILYLGIELT